MKRRNALKWLTGSTAAVVGSAQAAPGQTEAAPHLTSSRHPIYDPDFSKPVTGTWPRLLTDDELNQVKALADIILPKDDQGPAASEIGVPEFINEWLSAPYPEQQEHCEIIRGGLSAMNTECFRKHQKAFVELTSTQQAETVAGSVESTFFTTFRQLCLGGYYTHSSTWAQLGYEGNVTIAGPYPGVPPEILQKLDLSY